MIWAALYLLTGIVLVSMLIAVGARPAAALAILLILTWPVPTVAFAGGMVWALARGVFR